MKKILIIISFIFLSIFLISCEEANGENIDSNDKIELVLNGTTLNWNKLDNVKGYEIYVNDEYYKSVYKNTFEINRFGNKYSFKVRASFNDLTFSSFSNTVIFDDVEIYPPTIFLDNKTLHISPVDDAIAYDIYLNYTYYKTTTDLIINLELTKTTYIYVTAKSKDNKISSNSNVILYENSNGVKSYLDVFSINDTHGALRQSESGNDFSRVATIIKRIETGNSTLKIANGDIFQGTYVSNTTRGRIFIDALNMLNFDLFVIGNHEFDWGIEEIAKFKDQDLSNGEANFPFLGCNIIRKETNQLLEFLEPYTIINKDNLKIGIIGAIGENEESDIAYEKIKDYEFIDPLPYIKTYAEALRKIDKCDMVIVSIHDYDESFNDQIAALTGDEKIDGLICGHTHQLIRENLNRNNDIPLPVMQSNTKNLSVGSIHYELIDNIPQSSTINHYYPDNYNKDSDIENLFNTYQTYFDEADTVIGTNPSYKSRQQLGIYAVNAIKEKFNSDLAVLNTGGVRTTINAGEVTVNEVFEVFPFDNQIIEVTITSSQLQYYMNQQSDYIYYTAYNIEPNKTYKLAIVDYVFFGEYGQYYFKDCPYQRTSLYIRDIVIDAVKTRGF